ncbi:Epoxide hydrolase [Labilithrix luteola]|uniref:Epoxide hydrolase n=2 Tax=Labilithrix luteola TaxID=1391654 RepID=A0A0K1PQU1_9BACT|nr:Epoxide hydrolase [Labilithrix luteola]
MGSLRRRLRETRWPVLPDSDDRAHDLMLSTLRPFVEEWDRWLAQPPRPGAGEHAVLGNGARRVHVARFAGAGRVPILLLHGWPTSFLAFHRVIEPLRAVASEVVLASLPGFGTSPLPSGPWSIADSARLLAEAMSAMGHRSFIVHGQDWGSVVARAMGALEPDRVLGVHVSAGLRGFMADGSAAEPAWTRLREFVVEGGGYLQLQSRRPRSLAFALSDSPAGQLAWQLDKYQLWQGELHDDFGLGTDFILANATLYWLTGTGGTSMHIYSLPTGYPDTGSANVPTGVSVFRHGDFASRAVSSRENELVAWYEHDTGGHVASLDSPSEFLSDLTHFIDLVGANA